MLTFKNRKIYRFGKEVAETDTKRGNKFKKFK
jgi:hypothetical protein